MLSMVFEIVSCDKSEKKEVVSKARSKHEQKPTSKI